MSLTNHTLLGIGVSTILYPFFGLYSLYFLISSTLIDIDHYFSFIVKTRFSNFNPKIMFNYCKTLLNWRYRNDLLCFDALHTAEFLILIGIYAYISKSFIVSIILSGFIFHIICDSIYLATFGVPFGRAHSFLEYFIRRRLMKQRGLDIDAPHSEAIEFAKSNKL